jgi:hypothetical protein
LKGSGITKSLTGNAGGICGATTGFAAAGGLAGTVFRPLPAPAPPPTEPGVAPGFLCRFKAEPGVPAENKIKFLFKMGFFQFQPIILNFCAIFSTTSVHSFCPFRKKLRLDLMKNIGFLIFNHVHQMVW